MEDGGGIDEGKRVIKAWLSELQGQNHFLLVSKSSPGANAAAERLARFTRAGVALLAVDVDKLRGVTPRWVDVAVRLVESHPALGLVGGALPAGAKLPTDPDGDGDTQRLRYVASVRASGAGIEGGFDDGSGAWAPAGSRETGAGGPVAISRQAMMDPSVYETGPERCAAADVPREGAPCEGDPGLGLSARLWHAGWHVGYLPLDDASTMAPLPGAPPSPPSPPPPPGKYTKEGRGKGGRIKKDGGRGGVKNSVGAKGGAKDVGGEGLKNKKMAPRPCDERGGILSEEEKTFIEAAVAQAGGGGGSGGSSWFGDGGAGVEGERRMRRRLSCEVARGGAGAGSGADGSSSSAAAAAADATTTPMVGSMAIHYHRLGHNNVGSAVKALLKTIPQTRAESGRFEMLVNVDSRSEHAMWLTAIGPDDWLART